ncbi:hypothetical protein D9757_006837 [Collybiopsis confluens]|uniref:Uncharacterized protein n=1 Tax=Collybiopsis confluens TaxID=2823264 RepID=A0A8H5HPP5_9AGAR|nr:hypothetical protein D9757_006837 [Collybiopsis confluens]
MLSDSLLQTDLSSLKRAVAFAHEIMHRARRSDDGRTNAWALAMNVIRLLHVPLELGFNLFTLFWTLAVDYEYRAMVSPS